MARYGLLPNKELNIPLREFFLKIFLDNFCFTSSSLHLSFSSINQIVASLAVSKFQNFFGTDGNSQGLNFPGYALSIIKYGLPLNKSFNILVNEFCINIFADYRNALWRRPKHTQQF